MAGILPVGVPLPGVQLLSIHNPMHVLSFPFSAPYSGFFVPLEARASFVHNLLHVNTRRLKFCPSLDLSMRAARAHIRVQKGEAALMGEVPHSCLVSTPRCGIPHLVAIMCLVSKYSSGPSGCPLHTLHHVFSGLFRSPLCVRPFC